MAALGTDERIDVVGIAADGHQALELADRLVPDLVLMDVDMPVVDGLEATRRLRQALPSTTVLIITGVDSQGTSVENAMAAGAAAYLHKDANFAEMMEAIFGIALPLAKLQAAVSPRP